MNKEKYAIIIDEHIIPIHIIETNLFKKDIYNSRKPLRGENTSRGVITAGNKTNGKIKCRITNSTAPYLLYIVTGREISAGHVPETKSMFWRKFEIEYDTPPRFSLIEITEQQCTEYQDLEVKGFSLLQSTESPMQLEIEVESTELLREIITPVLQDTEQEYFFYLPEEMKISSSEDETIIKIDYPVIITEIPLYIEAKSRDEYEQNRYGCFRISLENLQFERFMEDDTQSRTCRHDCYGRMEITVYFSILN